MILRRFMEHIKDQNWFAVGLDVIVVIVGIFLGMQVQQWYEEQTEKNRIAAQLLSFRNELVLSLDNLADRQAYYEARIANVAELRMKLENGEPFVVDDFNRLMMDSIRGGRLNVVFRGYDEMAATGAISKVGDEHLRNALYEWDLILSTIRNIDERFEDTRETILLPIVLESVAIGNAFQSDERYQDFSITSRFDFDLEDIRSNRKFDNALATRHVHATVQRKLLLDFITTTNNLIVLLKEQSPK